MTAIAIPAETTTVMRRVALAGKRFSVIPEIKPFRLGIAKGATPSTGPEFGATPFVLTVIDALLIGTTAVAVPVTFPADGDVNVIVH